MHGKTQIKLNGEIIPLHFNNFAKVELSKILLPRDGVFPPKPEELELLAEIERLNKENHLLLLSRIIYAGIVGDTYAKDEIVKIKRSDVTKEVANADQNELYDCWAVFLESMGFNLDKMIKANREAEKAISKAGKKKANQ